VESNSEQVMDNKFPNGRSCDVLKVDHILAPKRAQEIRENLRGILCST
jgi:hypothetical protein